LSDLEANFATDLVFLAAKLQLADSAKTRSVDAIIAAADAIRAAIDTDALALYFGVKHKQLDDPAEEKLKKEMEAKKAALVDALHKKALAQAERTLGETTPPPLPPSSPVSGDSAPAKKQQIDPDAKAALTAAYHELESYIDTTDSKYLALRIAWERVNGDFLLTKHNITNHELVKLQIARPRPSSLCTSTSPSRSRLRRDATITCVASCFKSWAGTTGIATSLRGTSFVSQRPILIFEEKKTGNFPLAFTATYLQNKFFITER